MQMRKRFHEWLQATLETYGSRNTGPAAKKYVQAS